MSNLISPQLQVRKLIIVGSRKNYEVNFHKGLNIIYGDSDTGKSSILNLIDYLLGARKVYLYSQIQETGKQAILEVSINGSIYTIRRDIFNPLKEIEVFSTDYYGIGDVFPTKYYPHYGFSGELEYFSDFLMTNLGMPKIQIKESPSKEDSRMVRLSFRDIFKYCFLDQDEVGSKSILNSNDFVIRVKNQEVFKYLFNILDSNITQIQAAISESSKHQEDLNKKYKTISAFLRDANLKSEEILNTTKGEISTQVELINREIAAINATLVANSEEQNYLRQELQSYDTKLQEIIAEIEINEILLKNNVSLKKEYIQDSMKIKASLEVLEKVVGPTEHKFSCPLCSSDINVTDVKEGFDEYEKRTLESELKNLKKRINEIDSLISSIKSENDKKQDELLNVKTFLKSARERLDKELKELVSPYLSQIEKLVSEKASLEESLKSLNYLIKIRYSLNEIDASSIALDNHISGLKEKLKALQEDAPDPKGILSRLADLLMDFLSKVKLNALYGVDINSRLFLPILRGKEYSDITSGGVRTLVSIGYILSLLNYSLQHSTNHPKLVMIDSVGKYLGKIQSRYNDTDIESDKEEGIVLGDPSKYIEMYKYFIDMNKLNNNYQLIIVDNELPEVLEDELQDYVVRHFDVKGSNGLPKGLIDDAA